MGCRCSICRCLIELCDDELVPRLICIRTIPGSGSGVSGVPPDEMSSRLQTPLRTCELEVDFIQWQGYWLILISVCLSGSASDICHSSEDVISQPEMDKTFIVWVFGLNFTLELLKVRKQDILKNIIIKHKYLAVKTTTNLIWFKVQTS